MALAPASGAAIPKLPTVALESLLLGYGLGLNLSVVGLLTLGTSHTDAYF